LQLYRDADVKAEARKYLNDKVKDVESAIQGAEDILAELASDDPAVRQKIRSSMERYGRLTTKEKKKHTDDKKVYKMYYDYSERI
ncbi:RNA-binding transcriptional accessory protein, partial [Desulfovibrio desulfuricans]